MNKLVIFDLDGTVMDTIEDICDSMNYMLRYFGYREISVDDTKRIVGDGMRKLVIRGVPETVSDEKLDEMVSVYHRYYDGSGSPKTKLFDGIKEVVNALKDAGYYTAVLSNKPQESVNVVAEKYLKECKFDVVLGQSETVKCKPDPTATLDLLKKFNVLPQNAYLVGDGETDVLTSIKAGVNGVFALWGNRTKEQLFAAGGKFFISKPSELLKILL